jgi:hypothetical protein
MFITDRLTITDKRRTNDGYLVTTARFARSGIYEYAGRDVGKPDMSVVRVYRPDSEVFSEDAMASFAHRPITNDHPGENVSAQTWKRDAVGFTDGRVARDGDFVVVPMMVTDAEAITEVDGGKAELSAGYTCDLDFVDGATEDGQKYDAVMKNIRGNHIAIVDRGRAGSDCRIGDDNTGGAEMNLRTILVDGFSVETTPAGETAIVNLQTKLQTADKALQDANAAHSTAISAKDKELADKDAEIADLKGKVLDAAALKLVSDRAKLVTDAKRLHSDYDATGKDAATIRRDIVKAKCGDSAVADKSDDYVASRFDHLLEQAGNDGSGDALRDHVLNGGTGAIAGTSVSAADAQRAEREALDAANDHNGWRNKQTA